MVGKRRSYKPYSKEKIKVALYNTITARMGVFGTESLLLQMTALNYATAAADSWDRYGSFAAQLFNSLKSKYNLTGLQAAAVRALVGTAIKYLKETERGGKPTVDEVTARLNQVITKLGIDIPNVGSIVSDIAGAIASQ